VGRIVTVSKELQQLHKDSEVEMAKLVFTGNAVEDAEILLTGMIQARGTQVFEFITAEAESKYLSAKGLVELHDKLIEQAIADGNTIEALAAVQSFQKCRFNSDQILKSIERLYVVAKRTGIEPNKGAANLIKNSLDMRNVAKAIDAADYEEVVRKL